MRKAGAWATKWIGRLVLVAVPYVVLCTLFLPRAVQPLNPLLCASGEHLDNHSVVVGGTTSNGADKSLAMVCREGGTEVNVTAKVLAFIGVLIIVAFASFTLSARLARPRYLVPKEPSHL